MNTDRDQLAIPGTRAPAPLRKARLYQDGRTWKVDVPTPWGVKSDQFREWGRAIRYLDLVTKRRRRKTT